MSNEQQLAKIMAFFGSRNVRAQFQRRFGNDLAIMMTKERLRFQAFLLFHLREMTLSRIKKNNAW